MFSPSFSLATPFVVDKFMKRLVLLVLCVCVCVCVCVDVSE